MVTRNSSNDERFLIGRHRTCHIILRHDSVSRRHAEIHVTKREDLKSYFILDLESVNGTFIRTNAGLRRIEGRAQVSPSDTVVFGTLEKSVRELLTDIDLLRRESPVSAANQSRPLSLKPLKPNVKYRRNSDGDIEEYIEEHEL